MGLFNKHTRAKLYWHWKKLLTSDKYQLDETQKYVLKITRSIISKPETEFFESTIDCLTYIHWDHITIKLNHGEDKLIMMNGKYYYYFSLPSDSVKDLLKRIRKVTDARTTSWEKQFTNNTLHNLQSILTEVQDK